jgi:phosphohistidine phosphatase SixA
MNRPNRESSHPRAVAARVALGLLAMVLTAIPVAPAAGQTPETVGTPAVSAFRLVAQVRAEEWAALATAPATPVAGENLAGPELLATLREGGYVIYFWHAITDRAQTDSDLSDLANCATQRNLTEEGRAQSRLIGDSISVLAIPIGEVLSSELCRARETAELAFGRATTMQDLSSFGTAGSETEELRRVEVLRRLLATPPAADTNTVIVGHQFNIGDAAGVSLAEGEAAVFLPLGAAETSATPRSGS